MTNLEYITAKLGRFNLSDEDCEVILLDNGLNADDEVSVNEMKLAIYNSLSDWFPLHKSITEGGVNETWDYEAVKLYYSLLCKELGKENIIDTLNAQKTEVCDRSNIW